jgi:plastocyanin
MGRITDLNSQRARILAMTPARTLTALFVALLLTACGSSRASSSRTPASAAPAVSRPSAVSVSISGYAFKPATITVPAGTRITFTNHDQTAHTATSTAQAFDTGSVAPGASRGLVLHRPGTYTYYCQFHAFMRATVIVK